MERERLFLNRVLRSSRAILLFLGAAMILRGYFYAQVFIDEDHRIPALEEHLPLWVWATAWIVGGAVVIFCAMTNHIPAGAAVAGSAFFCWFLLFFFGWLLGQTQSGYSTCLQYLTISLLTAAVFARTQPVHEKEVVP